MEKSPLKGMPPFREALGFWFKLGWISFGGTAGHIAIMHDFLVDKKKWISNSRFFHALSLCMLLPGPEAQQLAIYIGWKLHGKKGGVVAGTLFVLPSMLIILLLSIVYVKFGNLPLIAALFSGLKPAVVALIIVAVVRLSRKAITGGLQLVVAILALGAIYFFNISLLLIIGVSIVLAFGVRLVRPAWLGEGPADGEDTKEIGDDAGVDDASVDDASIDDAGVGNVSVDDAGESNASEECVTGGLVLKVDSADTAFSLAGLSRLVTVFLFIWAAPLILLYFFSGSFAFWKTLALFWTQAALFTIGGSYTVLPYVAQFAVSKLHWLTRSQMVDGFALAETTPGPLIIVVAYVGFLAGYHAFNQSIPMASLALLLTTYYTFLPCFFYIFAGGPLIERSHGNKVLQPVLNLVTAAIVGMIVNLTLFLGKDVVFPEEGGFRHTDLFATCWVLICLLLILKWNIKVLYLIVASLGYGLARSYLI